MSRFEALAIGVAAGLFIGSVLMSWAIVRVGKGGDL